MTINSDDECRIYDKNKDDKHDNTMQNLKKAPCLSLVKFFEIQK